MRHNLKTWPEFFQAVIDLKKRFEIRKNDRGFSVGDIVVLEEYSLQSGYTGRKAAFKISYILDGGFGLEPGFVILSLGSGTSVYCPATGESES